MDDIPDTEGQHNMPTTPAIIKNEFGKGKVLLFSPHLEKTEELRDVLYELLTQVLTDK